jgi:hypothetical protein
VPTTISSGADHLADPDQRGVGEHRGRRNLQARERLLPLLARHRVSPSAFTSSVSSTAERFAQPEDPRVPPQVLERHDQDAGLGTGRRAGSTGAPRETYARPHEGRPARAGAVERDWTTHVDSPVPRQATTRFVRRC